MDAAAATGGALAQADRDLLIFPCNGNGLEALACLGAGDRLRGFIDDMPEKQAISLYGHRVLPRSAFEDWPEAQVIAVPGSPATYMLRRQLIESLGVGKDRFTTLIHPGAHVSPFASIGHNVLLMAGVVVTSNAVIGNHVCVLPNTVVHHDTTIGDWTLIGSNVTIAGGVVVEQNCYIASGSTVMNGLRVGRGAMVGLGSSVIRDVAPGAVVAGNPARRLMARRS